MIIRMSLSLVVLIILFSNTPLTGYSNSHPILYVPYFPYPPAKEIARYIHGSIFHDVTSIYLGWIYGNAGVMIPSCRIYDVPSHPIFYSSLILSSDQSLVIEVKFRYVALRYGRGRVPSELRGRLILNSRGDFQYLIDEAWPLFVYQYYPFMPLGAVEYIKDQVSIFSSEMTRNAQDRIVYGDVLTYTLPPEFNLTHLYNELMSEELIAQALFSRYTLAPLLGSQPIRTFPIYPLDPVIHKIELRSTKDKKGRILSLIEATEKVILREYQFDYQGETLTKITVSIRPITWGETPIQDRNTNLDSQSMNRRFSTNTPIHEVKVIITLKNYGLGSFPSRIEYWDRYGCFVQFEIEEVKKKDQYLTLSEQKAQLQKWNPYPRIIDIFSLSPQELSRELPKWEKSQGIGESWRLRGLIICYHQQKRYQDIFKVFHNHLRWLTLNSHPAVVRSEILQTLVEYFRSPLAPMLLETFWSQISFMPKEEFYSWEHLRSSLPGLFILLTLRQFHLSPSKDEKEFYVKQFFYACCELDRQLYNYFLYRDDDDYQRLYTQQAILKTRFKNVNELEITTKAILSFSNNLVTNLLPLQRLVDGSWEIQCVLHTKK